MTFHPEPGPDGPGRFSFITLGCKSNQYDSAAMAAGLQQAGLEPGPVAESDVIVINTCMVTGPTEAQCRKAIRQARRTNAGARLVVSGCMSAGSRAQIEAMQEVDLVIEPSEKGALGVLLGLDVSRVWTDWPEEPAVDLGERDRGFLKVQDGCDASCSYCVVPLVRGRSRSLAPERVLDAVLKLMGRGAREVVLSGIHLGQYGNSQETGTSLEDLLELLLDKRLPGRLRLSSIEPLEITSRLVNILAGAQGEICRHIHIPLQSGSDRILDAMGRPYQSSDFTDSVIHLREAVPGIGIGCDVICGFPGESEEDFHRTLDLIQDLRIPFIHAFPFSPRQGTRAASMKDDVPHRVKKDRVSRLRNAAAANRAHFAGSFIGGVLETALESRADDKGRRLGLSDNYLKVAVDVPEEGLMAGELTMVRIEGFEGDFLLGHAAGAGSRG